MKKQMTCKLLKLSLDPDLKSPAAVCGHLVLRISTGLMIFYIHGWHKLEGGLAYLQHGTPWKLAEEVAGMHFPAPLASAFAATAVQFICAPLVAIGLFTRLNAALLVATLSVAILQNLLAGRDPQLAILYVLAVLSIVLLGGGKFSLDARFFSRCQTATLAPAANSLKTA
jgi:putative oxidoreductase